MIASGRTRRTYKRRTAVVVEGAEGEKGKITQSVKNFRWNESPLFMLQKIEEIEKAERTATGIGRAPSGFVVSETRGGVISLVARQPVASAAVPVPAPMTLDTLSALRHSS